MRIAQVAPERPARTGTYSTVLPLRATGDREALFCVPPAVGIGWSYARLLRWIEPDRPVYALQTPGFEPGDRLPDTMPELVATFTRHIREIQPDGPYHLIGWSFGGVAAHAIATGLRRAGAAVGLLAVLDGYPVSGRHTPLPTERETLQHLLSFLGCDAIPPDTGVLPLAWAARVLGDRLLWPADPHRIGAMVRVLRNNIRLLLDFVPDVFGGDMALFTARPDPGGHPAWREPRADRWRPYVAGRIAVHEVPGTHEQMLDPAALAVIAPQLAGRP